MIKIIKKVPHDQLLTSKMIAEQRAAGEHHRTDLNPSLGVKANATSQWAQWQCEPVINKVFQVIGEGNKSYVDLGCLNGEIHSNTKHLRLNGWTGVGFDGESSKPSANIFKMFLTAENINETLDKHNTPEVPDFLDIDIDGVDFWILAKVLEKRRPRVVMAEVNDAMPNDVPLAIDYKPDFVLRDGIGPKSGLSVYYGMNMLAMYRLMKQYEYEFITMIGTNALFVIKEEFEKFTFDPITEEEACTTYFNDNTYFLQFLETRNRSWCVLEL